MALLTFSFALFNYSPNSTYVNIFYIVSFDVIRPLRGLSFNQGFTKFLIILPNYFADITAAVDKYVNRSI